MELLKSHFFLIKKAYIESFIILLFLSCCPFIVSSCHEEEKEEIPESPFDEEDIQHEQDLNAYLGKSYSCKISQVSVMESSVQTRPSACPARTIRRYDSPSTIETRIFGYHRCEEGSL